MVRSCCRCSLPRCQLPRARRRLRVPHRAQPAVTGSAVAAPAASPSGGGLLALDAARHVVWVTSPSGHRLLEIDTRTRRVLTVMVLAGSPRSITVDPVTHPVYVGLADGRLQVLAPNGRCTLALVSLPGPVTAVAVDPGHHRVYATTTSLTAGHAGALTAVDDRSEHRIRTVSAGRDPGSVAVDTARHTVWVLQRDTGRLTEFEGTLTASTRVLDGAPHTAALALAVDPTAAARVYLLTDTPTPPVLVTLSSAVTGVAEVQRIGGVPVVWRSTRSSTGCWSRTATGPSRCTAAACWPPSTSAGSPRRSPTTRPPARRTSSTPTPRLSAPSPSIRSAHWVGHWRRTLVPGAQVLEDPQSASSDRRRLLRWLADQLPDRDLDEAIDGAGPRSSRAGLARRGDHHRMVGVSGAARPGHPLVRAPR